MSRIGKLPIKIPKGVDVKLDGRVVRVKGAKGQLQITLHDSVDLTVKDGNVVISPKTSQRYLSKFHGLTRSIVNNMVLGVSEGFSKTLTLVGVGYRAQPKGSGITLSLGYSHPIDFDPPSGVEIKVDKQNIIVSGINKEDVGLVAAKLRGLRPPEPYHGKGVRYADEQITIKVGKAAAKFGS